MTDRYYEYKEHIVTFTYTSGAISDHYPRCLDSVSHIYELRASVAQVIDKGAIRSVPLNIAIHVPDLITGYEEHDDHTRTELSHAAICAYIYNVPELVKTKGIYVLAPTMIKMGNNEPIELLCQNIGNKHLHLNVGDPVAHVTFINSPHCALYSPLKIVT